MPASKWSQLQHNWLIPAKLNSLLICAFMAFSVFSGYAQAGDWGSSVWECTTALTENYAGSDLFYGVGNTTDVYCGQVLSTDINTPVYAGVYHEYNPDFWIGPTGFYTTDFLSPVPLVPGASETWLVYMWADPILDPSVTWIGFKAQVEPIPVHNFRYFVTLLSKPDGVEGGPAAGTSWDLSSPTIPGAIIEVPAYRTDNGLNGYVIELAETYVPEPSALAVLVCGLVGVLTQTRMRRSL